MACECESVCMLGALAVVRHYRHWFDVFSFASRSSKYSTTVGVSEDEDEDGVHVMVMVPPMVPMAYALSSFSYGFASVLAYILIPHGTYPGRYQYDMCLLGLLQSVLSYGCDAYTFGKASIFKPLDRLHSRFFILYFLSWQWCLFSTSSRLELHILFFCFVTGAYSFARSLGTLMKPDASAENFNEHVNWHILWHIILPAGYLGMGVVRASN